MNPYTQEANTVRHIHTPSPFARQNLLYVQEAGRLQSKSRHISSRSQLESYLFFIVLSGSGTVTIDGTLHQLSAGDHVFLDCRRPYAHESSDQDPWELLWAHFQGNAMTGYSLYFAENQLEQIFRPPAPSVFQNLLEQILTLEHTRTKNRELLENDLLHRLMTALLTYQPKQQTGESSSAEKIAEVRRYLDEHYTEKFSLDELAERFYISKYHLAREFKKTFRTTIVAYLTALRVTKAKEMLRFSDLQIEAIARGCGIDDNSYFNKVFRRAEGITAREYRKKWRGQSRP